MATKTIAWTTGSGYITLTYTGQGNGSITVSSDENDSTEERTQSFTIVTTKGTPEQAVSILIKQKGKSSPIGDVFNFAYTGSVQQVTLPKGKYKLQCWGAQGGASHYDNDNGRGSRGGYSEGVISLTKETTLYIFVGGKGRDNDMSGDTSLFNGGWNGGGGAVGYSEYEDEGILGASYPACGGGATDISTVTSSMSYSNGRTNRSSASLLARCIVAGGGGGASMRYTYYDKGYEKIIIGTFSGELKSITNSPYGNCGYVGPTFYLNEGDVIYLTYDVLPIVNVQKKGLFKEDGTYIDGVEDSPIEISESGNYYVACYARNRVGDFARISVYTRDYSSHEAFISSNDTMQGGGILGKGQHPGTQTSAGYLGAFGFGASQLNTDYRFCGGGGGGGWYGGGSESDDDYSNFINYNGGGSGFVNTSANASSRPSGYTGLQLDSGTTIDGSLSFESPNGGTEVGHEGNGYARITYIGEYDNEEPPTQMEYTELEYIESTGTQYIDTGFKHNQDTRVVMKVQPTSITGNVWLFEGRAGASAYNGVKGIFFYYSGGQKWNVDYNVVSNRKAINGIAATDMLSIDYNKNVCTINGKSITYTAATFQSQYNLVLLACNTAGAIANGVKAKLYSCKIYDNDLLIRDFVPVKKNSGEIGLLDKVNNVFYKSASDTDFIEPS